MYLSWHEEHLTQKNPAFRLLPGGLGDTRAILACEWMGKPAVRRRYFVDEYEKLKKLVADIDDDMKKALGGNKAAGTRVRGAMQDVKNLAQEIRKKVLELRDDAAKQ